ncbi:hypothetical protein SHELI_v1c03820 [Spiroplasma helicoides]|uniref:Uncharacterized protein n=1 Tax=Spiroplasma helicoides TaxID=216938 RepID=A0A1B3SK87_9MOLU|nr:hypothetical protein [Spiroplasma helicoides]AOG60335.1 hypothetical protein SHELI_v1c03820 [Spiroplasma helicoides]
MRWKKYLKDTYKDSYFHLETFSNGKVVFKQYYKYLKDVFEFGPENYKKIFFEADVVDLETGQLKHRDKIDLETAYALMDVINNVGNVERLYEIGYIKREETIDIDE